MFQQIPPRPVMSRSPILWTLQILLLSLPRSLAIDEEQMLCGLHTSIHALSTRDTCSFVYSAVICCRTVSYSQNHYSKKRYRASCRVTASSTHYMRWGIVMSLNPLSLWRRAVLAHTMLPQPTPSTRQVISIPSYHHVRSDSNSTHRSIETSCQLSPRKHQLGLLLTLRPDRIHLPPSHAMARN